MNQRTILAVGAALAVAASPIIAVAASPSLPFTAAATPAFADESKVIVTDDNFDEVLSVSNVKPVVFMKSAAWCTYCQQLKPKMDELAAEFDGAFLYAYVDVDDHPRAGAAIDKGRRHGLPTLYSYENGVETAFSIGGYGNDKAAVRRHLQQLIAGFSPSEPDPKPTPTMTPTSTPTPTPTPTETPTPTPTSTNTPGGTEPVTVTPDNHDAIIASSFEQPLILDFTMEGCLGCEQLKPILLDKLKTDDGVWTLGMLDGKKYPGLHEQYDKPWFPTLVAVVDGEEIARRTGYAGEDDKQNVIDWIDTVKRGEIPSDEPRVIDLGVSGGMEEINDVSTRHPVIFNFTDDGILGEFTDERTAVLKEMANGDGGKWTLVNLPLTHADAMGLARRNGVRTCPTLAIYFNGKFHLDTLAGEVSSETYRDYINSSLSYTYPTDGSGR